MLKKKKILIFIVVALIGLGACGLTFNQKKKSYP